MRKTLDSSKYLHVRNWDKWQSYRNDRGTPPWIKVYRRLMMDQDWLSLSDAEKGQLISFWMVAADRDGILPNDPETLRKVCHLDTTPDVKSFIDKGFLDNQMSTKRQPNDNQKTTKCQPKDNPEESRVEESREEKKENIDTETVPVSDKLVSKNFLEPYPKIWKAYKTLWKTIKDEHPLVEYPDKTKKPGFNKHEAATEVLSQIIRLDGISEDYFLDVWQWLFSSDNQQAIFWRGQVQSIEQLRKKSKGATLNKFQKICDDYEKSKKYKSKEELAKEAEQTEFDQQFQRTYLWQQSWDGWQTVIDDPNSSPERVEEAKIRQLNLNHSWF